MKICYADETGTDGKSPVLVVAGVVVDGVRLGATRDEFDKVLSQIQETLGKYPREIKGSDLYKKKNDWKKIDGSERHEIFKNLCRLVIDRKHEIALSVLDNDRVRSTRLQPDLTPWTSATLHIALQIQRKHQKLKSRKGDSLLFFDEHKESAALANLISMPPDWTDEYYNRRAGASPFNSIIDVPIFAQSHHIGLLQIADVLGFMFRRYVELHDYGHPEDFPGERDQLTGLVADVSSRLIERSHRYPRVPAASIVGWYEQMAPRSIKGL